jgi:ubiquinone/menaquinone biosynthesis C-methylase UbiE
MLDNGCGTGLLFDKIKPGQAVGLDISGEMLRYAAKHSDQLILGNSQKLPLKDNSFDVVFCRSLLHHLPEPELAISEISRVLRPQGEAVFADTNSSLLSYLPRLIAGRGKHFSEEHKNLTRREIEQLLKPYFKIQEVMYFGYIAYPLLGFPDILKLFKFIPFKSTAEPALMSIDNFISKIPVIRTQSWGIFIKAVKRDTPQE